MSQFEILFVIIAVELFFPIKVKSKKSELEHEVHKDSFHGVWDNPNERGMGVCVCRF